MHGLAQDRLIEVAKANANKKAKTADGAAAPAVDNGAAAQPAAAADGPAPMDTDQQPSSSDDGFVGKPTGRLCMCAHTCACVQAQACRQHIRGKEMTHSGEPKRHA